MPIIRNYQLDQNFDDDNTPRKPSSNIIKSSTLRSADQIVTPSQFDQTDSTLMDEDTLFEDPFEIEDTSSYSEVPTLDTHKSTEEPSTNEQQNELEETIKDLYQAINGLKKARDEVIRSTQDKLIDLSMAIAEKIVQKKIEIDPTVIQSVVEATFNKISGSDRITFRINPRDAQVFNEFQPQIESQLIGVEKINFQQDNTIDQGGCIIETDLGFLDVTIKEKLSIIAHAFRKIKSTL